ncbi:hypothetical protein PROFUN_15828 [Planoprotostelium fungivorum]|uniref:ABC transporter domain-containing protein n=1 Tax=Planoprotostelium fungivorum TaxID=1890364 RepID=A0A2P6MTC9_9EUKA|nr:hypothetical protein PROFUN_15828 [Planoprotostelium fungivorum]
MEYIKTCARQHWAMNQKHLLECIRSPKTTLAQLLIPIFTVLLFWTVIREQATPRNGDSIAGDLTLPPLCTGSCNSIVYWPLEQRTWTVMQKFGSDNSLSVAPLNSPLSDATSGQYHIIGLSSSDYFDRDATASSEDAPAIKGLANNGWMSLVGVSFATHIHSHSARSLPRCFSDVTRNMSQCVDFAVYSNNTEKTGRYRSAVAGGITQSLASLTGRSPLKTSFSYAALPNGDSAGSIFARGAESGLLAFLCTFPFVFLFSHLAGESESGMRGLLKTMSLKDWVYLSSWFIHHLLLFTVPISIVMIMLFNMSYFHLFKATDTSLMLSVVFSYGFCAVAWGSAWAMVLKKSRLATIIGFFFFIMAMVMGIVFSIGPMVLYIVESPSAFDHFNAVAAFFMFPTWHFLRILVTIQLKTSNWSFSGGSGDSNLLFTWDDMKQTLDPNLAYAKDPITHTPMWSLGMIWVNAAVYIFLMWYMDKVFPDPKKSTYPPWFLFTPSFWGFSSGGYQDVDTEDHLMSYVPDADLNHEMTSAMQGNSALRVQALRKEFKTMGCLGGKVALHHLYLTADSGTIVALLGHNGAGKTTLINILTGKINPTSGDAIVFGHSATYEMDKIQTFTGICPQHDTLWGDLTAQEHMRIMSLIRRFEGDDTQDILARVKLDEVSSISSQFSGGMKRRLQVAISLLGNPSVLFLDEPTTGMDPVNRRRVWDLVRDFKRGKLVFLTTHAMEEAEVLGEKIAVLTDGELRSVGSALHLKSKFSSGYRLNIITMDNAQEAVINMVLTGLPGSRLTESNSANLVFAIGAADNHTDMGMFLRRLEAVSQTKIEQQIEAGFNPPPAMIRDWGLSNSTLEDVFLTVTRLGHQ